MLLSIVQKNVENNDDQEREVESNNCLGDWELSLINDIEPGRKEKDLRNTVKHSFSKWHIKLRYVKDPLLARYLNNILSFSETILPDFVERECKC